jgi:manganese/zinc/iron transport system permease protein
MATLPRLGEPSPEGIPEFGKYWAWGLSALLALALLVPATQVEWTHTLRTVVLGGSILGVVCGALGSFAVLRQQSLLGDALAHTALPGIAIAFLISGRSLPALLLGAGVAGWVGILLIRALTSTTRIKQDTAMAIVLSSFFALGLALLAYIQGRGDASQAGLKSFIFGQAAAIAERDVWVLGFVGAVVLLVMVAFWKEFKLITFDPQYAQTLGIRARSIDLLLSLLVVVAIVLGLQLAGVVLMVGMLIAPAVAARQFTSRMGRMVGLAALLGGFAGGGGALVSGLEAGLPTGPLIVVLAVSLAFIALVIAPGRGLLWTWLKQRHDRRRFAAQNVLQDLYRHCLSHDDLTQITDEALLINLRGNAARLGLRDLQRDGLVQGEGRMWRLTQAGVDAAHAMELK